MRRRALACLAACALATAAILDAETALPRGPYLGQPPPGAALALFAPGFVNTGMPTRDAAFTPDGEELYFSVFTPGFTQAAILVTRLDGGTWTRPEVASFSADSRFRSIEPCISPDGKRLLFASDRPGDPASTQAGPFGIWTMDREGSGWSAPRRLGATINGEGETFFPSLTRDGTLYFTRDGRDGVSAIYRALERDGGYPAAERLPDPVNCGTSRYNAFVAPDESYVIVPAYGREDSRGGTDYYIVFRRTPDDWSAPQNLGPAINTPGNDEYSPHVTRDGRYFFFMANRAEKPRIPASDPLTLARLLDVTKAAATQFPSLYWIDAGFIERLRATAVFR